MAVSNTPPSRGPQPTPLSKSSAAKSSPGRLKLLGAKVRNVTQKLSQALTCVASTCSKLGRELKDWKSYMPGSGTEIRNPQIVYLPGEVKLTTLDGNSMNLDQDYRGRKIGTIKKWYAEQTDVDANDLHVFILGAQNNAGNAVIEVREQGEELQNYQTLYIPFDKTSDEDTIKTLQLSILHSPKSD